MNQKTNRIDRIPPTAGRIGRIRITLSQACSILTDRCEVIEKILAAPPILPILPAVGGILLILLFSYEVNWARAGGRG
jgi:hypothetical protein